VRRRGRRWIAVRPAVMEDFNERLQDRLRASVWAGCRSWYRADDGRIIALWPGFTREYAQAVLAQRFEDFEFG